jgi:hydroxybutyrate-dimer hydrolase
MKSTFRFSALALATLAALAGAGCSDDDETTLGGADYEVNVRPSFVAGTVTTTTVDGNSDDLLTAGLGASGLASATAPTVSATPTAAELRRLAIYTNYRALVDMTAAGGYGVFYGPNVDVNGNPVAGEGKIAGTEVMAFSDDGSGRRNVTLLVQIPSTFSAANACIVTATSSGSRGIWGGISTGEWGLKRGCAVAYTDKGTGAAPHDLQADTVPLIDGTRSSAAAAGGNAHFNAGLTAGELASFNAATPNRFAFKHAHSGRNPEADWGLFTRQAVEFAFWAINERLGQTLPDGRKTKVVTPANTIVIASSISNGGGAAIAAAEGDSAGLIDGVAVAEPVVNLPANPGVTVQRGGATVPPSAKPLYDYTTHANLYQACASLAPGSASGPFGASFNFLVGSFATKRCESLRAKGLLAGNTTAELATAALQKMRDHGWEADTDALHPSHAGFEIASAVSVTFANAYARASVKDNLCGYSYGSTSNLGVPNALAAGLPTMWAVGNGVPPAAGIQLINNNSVGGPLRDLVSFSPSTAQQDWNVDGALCLRDLLTGATAQAQAVQSGIAATLRNGRLGGRPTVIVHGRNDNLIPVNHTSRPYTALSKVADGATSQLSYVEVTNAQHFDAFIGLPAVLPGYDSRFVPLHLYLNRALDAVWARLKNGTALPPSQVVRTVPRGGTPGAAPALTAANVPAIAANPAAGDRITFSGTTLNVPD